MFAQDRAVVLDRGLTDATGRRHRHARLRQMDGWAEDALAKHAGATGAPGVADWVLADRLVRLGGYAPVTAELAAELSRADRDRLFLELRAGLLGERLQLTTRCENPACGSEVDLDLTVGELMGRAGRGEVAETVAAELAAGRIALRPVLGRDDPEAADIWPALVADGSDWSALSPDDRQRAALALARADTGPELGIAVACPDCSLLIEIEIDPLDLLARELSLGTSRLLAEVHCLAFHYGWTEADILALPRQRRWHYLALIAAQLTGGALTEDWR